MLRRPEYRNQIFLPVELRNAQDGKPTIIAGYASVFNVVYDVGWFKERIMPGAFTKTLKESPDVLSLLNHNQNFVLGRTLNNTLSLREDAKGLYTETIPADTTWEQDLLKKIKRGDQNQMSFAFQVIKADESIDNGATIRNVSEVRLFDVSVVTNGANPATSANVRALLPGAPENIEEIILRAQAQQLRAEDKQVIEQTIELLRQFLSKPEPGNHSGGEGSGQAQARRLAHLRRGLELVACEYL